MRQLSGRSVGRQRSRSRIEDVERQPQIALLSYSSWERRRGKSCKLLRMREDGKYRGATRGFDTPVMLRVPSIVYSEMGINQLILSTNAATFRYRRRSL